jgi:hypothetical protein
MSLAIVTVALQSDMFPGLKEYLEYLNESAIDIDKCRN